MTTTPLVAHTECLELFAKLGQLTRVLSENDSATMPGYKKVADDAADQRQALDDALQITNWNQPNVLEAVEDLYAEALGHDESDITVGLTAYLDHLYGVLVPMANSDGKSITFGVACAANMTGFDAIGAFRDVGPLRTWIAKHLAVLEDSISVNPMPGLPDTIFEGLYEFSAEMGRAISAPGPEDYTWSLATEPCDGNASDLVFWVTFTSTDDAKLQYVVDMLGEVNHENDEPIVLPFDLATGPGELEVVPCAVLWPFSACVESVFSPVLDAIEDATARLEERGFAPETISAELTISLEEDNLYGFDESFVIELRDAATGFILTRVPGFGAPLLTMFKPFFLDMADYLGCAEILVRPEAGAPTERYIPEEE